METLAGRLMQRGWRMTAQRRVIAGIFDAAGQGHVHLTADEVHARAAALLPEISRATVYNTLGEMVDAGELLAVNVGDRSTRYDPNVQQRHHHLVCRICGAIFDLPAGTQLDLVAGSSPSFTIESTDVIYRGRCANCQ